MTTGIIFNIMKYSVHDGPGIRNTVFLKGCPLNCWWCHNPESQCSEPELMIWDSKCISCGDCFGACPNQAIACAGDNVRNDKTCTACGTCAAVCHSGARVIAGRFVTASEVMTDIEKDIIFYDQSGGGVTFSGGEPLMQPEFLEELLMLCRKKYIHTTVDTTGYAETETLLRISKLTDLFLYDLKIMDEDRHIKFTGVSNTLILNNVRELSKCHGAIHIRFPLIPGINDDQDNVTKIGEFTATLQGVSNIHIIPYQHMGVDKYHRLKKRYRLEETCQPESQVVEAVAQTLKEYGLNVKIGG